MTNKVKDKNSEESECYTVYLPSLHEDDGKSEAEFHTDSKSKTVVLERISDKAVTTHGLDFIRIAHCRDKVTHRPFVLIEALRVLEGTDHLLRESVILNENEFRAFLKLQKEVLCSIQENAEDEPQILNYMR